MTVCPLCGGAPFEKDDAIRASLHATTFLCSCDETAAHFENGVLHWSFGDLFHRSWGYLIADSREDGSVRVFFVDRNGMRKTHLHERNVERTMADVADSLRASRVIES